MNNADDGVSLGIVKKQTSVDNPCLVFILLGVFAMIIISWIYAKCISRNDFFSVSSLITASIHIIDGYSDILFIVSISNQSVYPSTESVILMVASIVFVVLPLIITLFQLQHEINKWRRNDDLKQWINENVTLLYVLSVITGSSFSGVEICVSNLLNLHQFDMPLSKMALNNFQTKKMYSIVLCEVW